MDLKKPEMILFDYGQTLLSEEKFDGIAGTKAVLKYCVQNPLNVNAEGIQTLANEMNKDIGRYNPETQHLALIEVHNHPFQNYLYDWSWYRLWNSRLCFGIMPLLQELQFFLFPDISNLLLSIL